VSHCEDVALIEFRYTRGTMGDENIQGRPILRRDGPDQNPRDDDKKPI